MSEIRVILLGMKCSDISIVGNRILGRDAFEIDTPLSSVKQQSERARGTVEGRYITLINTPHLFDTEVSQEELTQRVKECVSLCAPGPHGIVLILQMDNFTERDRNRVHAILSTFSEEALNYTMVLTTLDMEPGTSVDPGGESIVQEVIVECRHRHLDLSRFSSAAFVELMEGIVKENGGSLTCEIYEEATEPLDDEETEDQE
ncbi:GTPase IMAP family member 9-like, partial [Hoplias malabaricus]|uniref:GTPase IMAP family member 9-like n=1 Tax=Hoplias malabaricus TaxID=27720 RepID=UPI003462A64B